MWLDPTVASYGKYHPRSEFVGYNTRLTAEAADLNLVPFYEVLADWDAEKVVTQNPNAAKNHTPLAPPEVPSEIMVTKYRTIIDIPFLWLDRDIFLHVERTGGAHAVYMNDRLVGYSDDSRTPAEYYIWPTAKDGINTIRIEVYSSSAGSYMETLVPQLPEGSLGLAYVYSQPKLRIDDFVVTAGLDSIGKDGVLYIDAVLANSYNYADTVIFGYDIYRPDGKLHTYNKLEVVVPGQGMEKVKFKEAVWPSFLKMWSPASPNLYTITLYTEKGGRKTEYIVHKIGFKETEIREGELYIDRKTAQLNAVNYNAAADPRTTEQDLNALKKGGFNTICVNYPQPRWFYELCDKAGFYVIDQANNNSGYRTSDRNVGGNLANNRDYLNSFVDRVLYMQGRSKNYTSVIATSLGGDNGNGYNLYKAFQHLNSADTLHPVTYRDPQGEWNTRFKFPVTRNAEEILGSR